MKLSDLPSYIHTSIQKVGGYWLPELGMLRVIEELGELSEVLRDDPNNYLKIAEEVSDLYIISTCIANQYCADLSRSSKKAIMDLKRSDILDLNIFVGKLARTINFYEGKKELKKNEHIDSVQQLITQLHQHLLFWSKKYQFNLITSVLKKLVDMEKRDKNRFSTSYDPSFSLLHKNLLIQNLSLKKIWVDDKKADKKLFKEHHSKHLIRFYKIATFEGLDAFLIQGEFKPLVLNKIKNEWGEFFIVDAHTLEIENLNLILTQKNYELFLKYKPKTDKNTLLLN